MTIKPFGRRILIKPVERAQVLIADDGTLNEYGIVVAVGDGVVGTNSPKVGDKLGFSVFGVEKLVIDDQKYYFIKEDDDFLLCTIQD